jgi:hypothetical protein
MSLDGGNVKVFGFGVEEGHCWSVDAWEKGTASPRVTVCPIGAIDSINSI